MFFGFGSLVPLSTTIFDGWVTVDSVTYSWPWEEHSSRRLIPSFSLQDCFCTLFVVTKKQTQIRKYRRLNPCTLKDVPSPGLQMSHSKVSLAPLNTPVAIRWKRTIFAMISNTYCSVHMCISSIKIIKQHNNNRFQDVENVIWESWWVQRAISIFIKWLSTFLFSMVSERMNVLIPHEYTLLQSSWFVQALHFSSSELLV